LVQLLELSPDPESLQRHRDRKATCSQERHEALAVPYTREQDDLGACGKYLEQLPLDALRPGDAIALRHVVECAFIRSDDLVRS